MEYVYMYITKWGSQNGLKMNPNGPPPPIPQSRSPSQARLKPSATRRNKLKQTCFWWCSMIFVKRVRNVINKSCRKNRKSYIGWWMEQILIPISPPLPISSVSKRLLPGGKQIIKKCMFKDFPSFSLKRWKKPFVRYCLMSKRFFIEVSIF